MKNNKKDDYIDDGHSIVDMSNVERPNLFTFKNPYLENRKDIKVSSNSNSEPYTKEQTRWAILGALKASLLIGLAYAVGIGLFILILYLFYKHFV